MFYRIIIAAQYNEHNCSCPFGVRGQSDPSPIDRTVFELNLRYFSKARHCGIEFETKFCSENNNKYLYCFLDKNQIIFRYIQTYCGSFKQVNGCNFKFGR